MKTYQVILTKTVEYECGAESIEDLMQRLYDDDNWDVINDRFEKTHWVVTDTSPYCDR